ncbi:hypothetical protein C8R48DRAFT_673996 [Suillus tomentosus]|nr:hypothetical protein C8R48DRAFT_673996 [Suillus tomentosus]
MSKCPAPTEPEQNAKHIRFEAPSPLQDPTTWEILEWFLMTDLTYVIITAFLIEWKSDSYCALEMCKNPYIDIEAEQGNNNNNKEDDQEEEDIKIDNGPLITPRFIAALLPRRMYVFTVHVTTREFLAKHLQKRGFPVIVSPWIPAHLYMTSNNPLTIMAAVHDSLKVSIKKWDCVHNDEETTVNTLHLKYPYPAWVRIKQGKYMGAIAYIFDSDVKS